MSGLTRAFTSPSTRAATASDSPEPTCTPVRAQSATTSEMAVTTQCPRKDLMAQSWTAPGTKPREGSGAPGTAEEEERAAGDQAGGLLGGRAHCHPRAQHDVDLCLPDPVLLHEGDIQRVLGDAVEEGIALGLELGGEGAEA